MQARIDRITGATNTWIVGDDDEAIIIDPGEDAAAVLDAVFNRDVLAVICTHGHAAHVAAALEAAKRDDAPVALHSADLVAWREAHPGTEPDIEIEDGGIFEVADVRLEVIHTPGHTPGSVSLLCEELEVLFSGDAIAGHGPVPHQGEFPDFPRQLSSIGASVLTLDAGTRILPGHGDELTVAEAERRFDNWVGSGPEGLIADADN